MKRCIAFGWWMIICVYAYAQTAADSLRHHEAVPLGEVVISAYTDGVSKEAVLNITSLPLKQIEQGGSFNLTDALAKLPGISQLSTGIGISKPVIRGLYGSRILVVFSGLRFDNQQWQDEHGMGLSDLGISRTEVIKGPLSLLYGTEAVGGVINILEEKIPSEGLQETDAGMAFHSNTLGGTLQAGIKANYGDRWYRIRIGMDSHADYSDGHKERVLNSRFNGYYLKSTYGFTKKNWHSENYYDFSYNHFGFVFNDLIHFFAPDARWTRQMNGPHHIVMLNILSSVNTIQLANSILKLNAGIQSNYRAENEGGGDLSLVMHLLTGQYALKWSKQLSPKSLLVLTNSSSLESNTNYGKRKIIPDAWSYESNLSAYMEHRLGPFILEYGVGGGLRFIKTLLTQHVNTEEKEIDPFRQTRFFGNGLLGVSYNPSDDWNFKVNGATGVRAPNLAELSSNGLHEGIYVYEIGDPDLKNEQNLNVELSMDYSGDWFQFGVAGFYNYFFSYLYLQPTMEEWFGFPVARFSQDKAALYGGEVTIGFTPLFTSGWRIAAAYSGMVGKLANGNYLPYIPAQKIRPEIRYDAPSRKNGRTLYGFVNMELVMQQTQVHTAETITPSYNLLNAGIGFTFQSGGLGYDINLAANNILNEAYYDHLSRFKTFDLLNIGRDISIHFKINLLKQLKTYSNAYSN